MPNLLTEFSERVLTLHNGAKGLRGLINVKITIPTDGEGDCIDMRASDASLDRYEEIIVAEGWDLKNYLPNPVIQNSHQYGNIIHTIGKARRTEVKDGALVQRWQFCSDINPFAKMAYGMYRGGYLNASSVGFIPKRWEYGAQGAGYYRKFLEQELLEVSAVGIPANANALALALKSGAVEKSTVQEAFDILKSICANPAGPATHASASGGGTHEAQLVRLVCDFGKVLKRA